jgi:predicted phage replisome organizer/uncharacterized phage protein (TIGR02220 family)
MADTEIKWIKITTNMFDDEKIKMIEAMPEADMILVVWVKLLTLAGRKNMNGYIFLTENIPYTDEMLSTLFNRPLNTIRLALSILKKFNMINYDENGFIKITNWDKHQNVAVLEKIREQNRVRQERYREKQKQISPPHTPPLKEKKEEREEERDREREREGNVTCNVIHTIINYLNEKAGKSYKSTTKAHQRLIKARLKEGFTVEDFKKVIDKKTAEWLRNVTKDGQNMANYLRPETLFGTKFESYLNQQSKQIKSIKQQAEELAERWEREEKEKDN